MRKIIFAAAIVALVIFTGVVMYKGTDGNFNIWGFTDIIEENKKIDNKNAELSTVITVDYPKELDKLKTSTEKLEQAKKDYQDQSLLLTSNKYYKQNEHYKHEFILVKIGNYADNNNVDLRIVVTNSSVSGLYDINFTVTGKYVDVTSYIYDIENDSRLGFKIEDFIMKDGNFNEDKVTQDNVAIVKEVTANFNCKEISIDLKWLDENESVIPGIITRGNPYIDDKTTLTGNYTGETLDRARSSTSTQNNTNTTNTTTQNTTAQNTTTQNTNNGTNTQDANTAQAQQGNTSATQNTNNAAPQVDNNSQYSDNIIQNNVN